jgi:hypothetical protein
MIDHLKMTLVQLRILDDQPFCVYPTCCAAIGTPPQQIMLEPVYGQETRRRSLVIFGWTPFAVG